MGRQWRGNNGVNSTIKYKNNVSTSVAILQFMKKIQKYMYGTVRFTVPATWCLTVLTTEETDERESVGVRRRVDSGRIDKKQLERKLVLPMAVTGGDNVNRKSKQVTPDIKKP
uniref:Uncharacterized protein n=1 Tax=Timema douglasi TaxID=61478 RepID=A0A7R8VGC8_TIMDO|nr:unnamed protein product [Timema douglasi]